MKRKADVSREDERTVAKFGDRIDQLKKLVESLQHQVSDVPSWSKHGTKTEEAVLEKFSTISEQMTSLHKYLSASNLQHIAFQPVRHADDIPNLMSARLHIEMEAQQTTTEEQCKEGALVRLGQDELRDLIESHNQACDDTRAYLDSLAS